MHHYYKKQKWLFGAAITLTLIANFAMLVPTSILKQNLINCALAVDISNIGTQILFLLLANALGTGVYILACIVQNHFANRVIHDMRCDLFCGVINKRSRDYHSVNSADYLSALTNDLTRIRRQRIGVLFSLIFSVAALIVSACLLFYFEPITALVSLLCAGLMTLVPIYLSKHKMQYELKRSSAIAKMTKITSEFFSGFEVISAFGISSIITQKFIDSSMETCKTDSKTDEIEAASSGLAQLFSGIAQTTVLCLACWMVYRNRMTIGALTAFITINTTFCAQLTMVMQILPIYKGVQLVVDRVLIYAKKSQPNYSPSSILPLSNGIHVHNLSYGYSENAPILNNVSIDIAPGEKYALTGESGSGKTTLIRILSGDYDDYTGKIMIGDTDLRSVSYCSLRKTVAVIHQEIFLFDDSIKNNICLFEHFSDEQFEKAIKLSGVKSFIEGLPGGIEYIVGKNGINLSGGQRQRIAIARALIRSTPFLIVDEGTSALDTQNAIEIETELLRIPELTLLVVSHHLYNESLYSDIWHLQSGTITKAKAHDTNL